MGTPCQTLPWPSFPVPGKKCKRGSLAEVLSRQGERGGSWSPLSCTQSSAQA